MPAAQLDEIADKRRSNRRQHSPYDQAGRKAKMTSSRNWSPSIWNALTFWKSGGASSEEEDEEGEEDAPNDGGGANGLDGSATILDDTEDGNRDPSLMNNGNLSEEQVSAHLTLQPPRHVRFKLPSLEQQRLNTRQPQLAPTGSEAAVRQGPYQPYVAPLPPSSPFCQSASPHKDPLSQVTEYIDHIIKPRGSAPTNVEALGLSSLIQEAVHLSERPSAAQYGTPQHVDCLLMSGSASSSVSPSPSPIRPTFTGPDTDIAALLASSAPSGSNQSSPSTSTSGRTLARNPNGTLYYQGGGSARSRYRSPSFSTPPGKKKVAFPRGFGEGKKESPRMNGTSQTAETPSPSDGKRRRVGEERDSSAPQASGSSPVMTNGTSTPTRPQQGAPANGPRFATSSPASRFMASTPARPSPLRQSVRADSSSPGSASPGSASGTSPRGRFADAGGEGRSRASEKASEIMAGIINDATPKKNPVPDVRNPYQPQSRSPTKRSRKPTAKAPRPPPRPTRQSAGPPPPPQPKKLSALETIQRTAPQAQTGSKRSHTGMPPPTPPSTNGISAHAKTGQPGSSADKPFIIEIEDDEEEEQAKRPPAKKQKQKQDKEERADKGAENERDKQAYIEVEDVDMSAPAENVDRPSEVIEPEFEQEESRQTQNLQQQQETKRPIFVGPFKKGVATARFQSVPKEPSPLRQSFQPDALPSPPKETVGGVSFSTVSDLASSAFAPASAPSPFGPPFISSTSAPLFAPSPTSVPEPAPAPSVFAAPSTAPAAVTSTDWLAVAKKQALDAPANTLQTFAFVFTASVIDVSGYTDQRDAALAAPVSELPKFDFTAALVPVPAPKSEVKAFDFAAAGMKPAVVNGWSCGLCGCKNDASATECSVCSEPKA